MEAGCSRSTPGSRTMQDTKKGGQKNTKKRNNVEEEEDQEEVRVTQRKKEQNQQLRKTCWLANASMLTWITTVCSPEQLAS